MIIKVTTSDLLTREQYGAVESIIKEELGYLNCSKQSPVETPEGINVVTSMLPPGVVKTEEDADKLLARLNVDMKEINWAIVCTETEDGVRLVRHDLPDRD